MKNLSPKDINDYINSAPKESQAKLLELRKIISTLVPKAEEGISYSMPVFKLNGQPLVGFAGYKKHIGFYPMSGSFLDTYQQELKNYKTSKGAVQFPLNQSFPLSLIKKLVRGKIREIKNTKQQVYKKT